MNQSMLVRHPAPHRTESLAGFIVRLAEANGYSSPRPLYKLAGMSRDEVSLTTVNLAKLAAITGQSLTCLQELALAGGSEDARTLRLLGNQVCSQDMSLTSASICPSCVDELGYVEAHWHLELMVACPVHQQAAVWFCGGCKKKVTWERSGLLECSCGNALVTAPRDAYTADDYWLLDLIRRKALGIPTSPRADLNLFERHVAQAPLHSLLSLVRFVGKSRLLAKWNKKPAFARQVLPEAASVLADWPKNFLIHLKTLAPKAPNSSPLVIGEHFEGLFEAIEEMTSLRFAATNQHRQVSQGDSPLALDRGHVAHEPIELGTTVSSKQISNL